MSAFKRFLLVGSPNTGKTTLFNALTGLHQKTANYSGVTIEKYIGVFQYDNSQYEIIDLPGIYSLYSEALEERLAIDEILNSEYDGLIIIINASQLEKHLLLVLQLLSLKVPSILVLNMIDEVQKKNWTIDIEQLKRLLKIPIVATNARKGEGLSQLKSSLSNVQISDTIFYELNFFDKHSLKLQSISSYKDWIQFYSKKQIPLSHLAEIVEEDLRYKHQLVNYIVSKVVDKKNFLNPYKDQIDKYLTHKVWGFLFLLLMLFIVFQLVFIIAEYPMEWIEWSMGSVSNWLQNYLPDTEWGNLLVNGVLPGITGVVMFIPQIALLFLMIGILEESGYMARISFLLDSVFSRFGLSGKSLIPLVSGVACAVPSILSTRTITNYKEKLITILVLPFMSCSARLPVYTLLIGIIFPDERAYGFLSIKGLVLLALYLFGLVMALLFAFIFHKVLSIQKKSFFFIELPSYKIPYWKNILIQLWNKVKIFIIDAGKIIVAISIILWYLSTHTLPSIQNRLNKKYASAIQVDSVKQAYQKELLENSYIGIVGKKIDPLIAPLGYDWKIGIALITSFAAREVFVGTMATLYSVNAEDDLIPLREKIMTARHTDTNELVFTTATSVSLLIYYALAMQCISTMVVVYRELKSIKWVIIQFLMMTGTAYVLAFLAHWWWS